MSLIRQSDILARYGGEEFSIILTDTDIKGGTVLAEKIRNRVESYEIIHKEQSAKITISLGVAQLTSEMENPSDLIEEADKALYHSKNNGRNQVSVSK